MRARRNAIHPASRRAGSARRNPPALDPREPTRRNETRGDITESTPRGGTAGAGGHDVGSRDEAAPPRREGSPEAAEIHETETGSLSPSRRKSPGTSHHGSR